MKPRFHQLNNGWNAEPYVPNPVIRIDGPDLVLSFLVNAFQFTEFQEGESAALRFTACERYRLGPPNDDGWYDGRCRFSRSAPEWGEFYLVVGDAALLDAPQDWHTLTATSGKGRHYLFYFRDNSFECVAAQCRIDPGPGNALLRTGKQLPELSAADLKPSIVIRQRLCRSQ